ncbi:winged helix-turn-helix transcriptional regulator [Streptacidiphilus carbonis]|jgi:DNA-binding HxlR family transcriptional regulator|uniref:winged helix-turn-helix transcriptional regulator n=1 Tax=Streptacidiphilus carbonis TaxID=105422 RepID=UPI0005A845C9|nr:helix-turn-helix domain-containing protein [Streptacidiphilus carbonis]
MPDSGHDGQRFYCPVELTLDLLGGKWASVVLAHLKEGAHRYGALRRRMPGTSEKVLVQRLRALEAKGLVERREITGTGVGAVPAVEYRLTEEGLSLAPVLQAMYTWGEQRAARTGARIEPVPVTAPEGG